MKRYNLCSLFILLLLTTCQKEKYSPVVDANGLTREINDIIPPDILEKMRELGMPIYGGQDPPLLEGTYTASTFVLESSSHPGDFVGKTFSDYVVTFSEQNNDALTIRVDYRNGDESGSGIGGFIVGDGCNFTVVVDIDSTRTRRSVAKATQVLSGTLLDEDSALGAGIFKFRFANMMIDDNGDPYNELIENGQGRVITDKDGYSPREGTPVLDWKDQVPDCPCTYDPGLNGKEERCGEWLDCGEASQLHHYGARYEIRWIPPSNGSPGQQCTYDTERRLITGGIAAGSPDRVSPRACGFDFGIISNTVSPESVIGHVCEDVVPWGDTGNRALCIGRFVRPVSCRDYLANWPANQPAGCADNIVNGIAHIERMVRNMHCADVTILLKTIATSTTVDRAAKDFIAGTSPDPPADLREQLQAHLDAAVCERINTVEPCRVLRVALRNL